MHALIIQSINLGLKEFAGIEICFFHLSSDISTDKSLAHDFSARKFSSSLSTETFLSFDNLRIKTFNDSLSTNFQVPRFCSCTLT